MREVDEQICPCSQRTTMPSQYTKKLRSLSALELQALGCGAGFEFTTSEPVSPSVKPFIGRDPAASHFLDLKVKSEPIRFIVVGPDPGAHPDRAPNSSSVRSCAAAPPGSRGGGSRSPRPLSSWRSSTGQVRPPPSRRAGSPSWRGAFNRFTEQLGFGCHADRMIKWSNRSRG